MIACVSPAIQNLNETVKTLRYAQRAKKIQNKPVINLDPREEMLYMLKKEIQALRKENDTIKEAIAEDPRYQELLQFISEGKHLIGLPELKIGGQHSRAGVLSKSIIHNKNDMGSLESVATNRSFRSVTNSGGAGKAAIEKYRKMNSAAHAFGRGPLVNDRTPRRPSSNASSRESSVSRASISRASSAYGAHSRSSSVVSNQGKGPVRPALKRMDSVRPAANSYAKPKTQPVSKTAAFQKAVLDDSFDIALESSNPLRKPLVTNRPDNTFGPTSDNEELVKTKVEWEAAQSKKVRSKEAEETKKDSGKEKEKKEKVKSSKDSEEAPVKEKKSKKETEPPTEDAEDKPKKKSSAKREDEKESKDESTERIKSKDKIKKEKIALELYEEEVMPAKFSKKEKVKEVLVESEEPQTKKSTKSFKSTSDSQPEEKPKKSSKSSTKNEEPVDVPSDSAKKSKKSKSQAPPLP
jgi:hypothetical protein